MQHKVVLSNGCVEKLVLLEFCFVQRLTPTNDDEEERHLEDNKRRNVKSKTSSKKMHETLKYSIVQPSHE